MKIKVNNTAIEIFNGAKVKDAIRKYYALQDKKVSISSLVIRDSYGNRVGEEGSLLKGMHLTIEEKSNPYFCWSKCVNLFKLISTKK